MSEGASVSPNHDQTSSSLVTPEPLPCVRVAEKYLTVEKIHTHLKPYFEKYKITEYNQQKRIRQIISRVITIRDEQMPTADELTHNFRCWKRVLVKDPNAELRWDDPEQDVYPLRGDISWLPLRLQRFFLKLGLSAPIATTLEYFVANFPEILASLRDTRDKITTTLKGGTLFIAVSGDSSTGMELPLIAHILELLGIPKEQINILLTPEQITHKSEFRAAVASGIVIKTLEQGDGVDATAEPCAKIIREKVANVLTNTHRMNPHQIVLGSASNVLELAGHHPVLSLTVDVDQITKQNGELCRGSVKIDIDGDVVEGLA